MAAKTPAAKKTAKSVKSSKTTQSKIRTRKKSGYTAAQRKAYNAASRAAIRRIQTLHNTTVARARKRAALQRTIGKLRVKGGQYIANRARAYAARQAYLQATTYNPKNKPLTVQLAHRLFQAQSVATQKHFAFKGQAIHLAAYRVTRVAKRKKATTAPKRRKARTGKSPYAAFGNEFGRAAAARLPGPKATSRKTSKKRKAAGDRHESLAHAKWITAGNDQDIENCVAVAIANSCLYHLGYRMTDEQVRMVKYDRLNKAMWMLHRTNRWWPVELAWYRRVDRDPGNENVLWKPEPGDVIGFETEHGSHCGVLLPDNKVISWGEVVPLEAPIDEAWNLIWTITG